MTDLERFKKFYKEPNQEDYNYFKGIIKAGQIDYKKALVTLLDNLDFQKVDDKTIAIVENQIDLEALHPIIRDFIKTYFEYVEQIQ